MNHKKFSLGSLFYNNKFVLIFSVFVALVIWVVFATRNTEEIPRTVTDADCRQFVGLGSAVGAKSV